MFGLSDIGPGKDEDISRLWCDSINRDLHSVPANKPDATGSVLDNWLSATQATVKHADSLLDTHRNCASEMRL